MVLPRTMLPFLMVAILAVLVAACGSAGGSGSGADTSESRDAGAASEGAASEGAASEGAAPAAGTPEATEAKVGATSFALTPEISACMTKAGLALEPKPAAGAVVSWRSDDGARVAIAPSTDAALTLAGTIGTAEAPANVDGTRVSAGPAATVSAAAACLDAA